MDFTWSSTSVQSGVPQGREVGRVLDEVRGSRGRQWQKTIKLGIAAFGQVSVDLTGSMSRKVGAMGENPMTWWCVSHVRESLSIEVILSHPVSNRTKPYPDMVQGCSSEQDLCCGSATERN